MRLLPRMFIKFALVWLACGLALWGASGWLGGSRSPFAIAAFHIITVGWLTQVVFGVALWFFPKQKGDKPYGSEALTWAVFGFLNTGVLLRILAEPWSLSVAWADSLVVVAGTLQTLAALGFVFLMRGRIRGP